MTTLARLCMTADELRALPPALDVVTAAQVLGVGETTARDLVRRGEWPSPVLRVGRQYRIPTAPLLVLLGIAPDMREAGPASPATALPAPATAKSLETA